MNSGLVDSQPNSDRVQAAVKSSSPVGMASPTAMPSATETLKKFLETRDLSLLDTPIVLEQHPSFGNYLCCQGRIAGCASLYINACFCPVAFFCPWTMLDRYKLTMDRTMLKAEAPMNDCCCHVAESKKTVPLDRVIDTQLQESCMLTCFDLKAVYVETAAGMAPEVSAPFLAHPDQVRDAISLAAQLVRGMDPGPGPSTAGGGGLLPPHNKGGLLGAPVPVAGMARGGVDSGMARLQELSGLVRRGVLSQAEADGIRVAVLGAEHPPLTRLAEAAELADKCLISAQEFQELKGILIARIRA